MTDAEAARPTVASLAQDTKNLTLVVEDIAEQANILGQTGEAEAKKTATLQKEVKALATLVHGITKDKPGEAVKPSKLDNALARVEALERAAGGASTDYQPAIDALAAQVNNLTEVVGRTPAHPDAMGDARQALTELQEQVDQLEARAERDGRSGDLVAAPVHEALADRIDDAHKRIDSLSTAVGQFAFKEPLPVAPGFVGIPAMGVHAKMLALMDEVQAIGKNRDAKGGGVNFKFRGVEDAQNAVGQAQRKVRILILPEAVSWEYGQEHVTSWDQRNEREKTVTWATSRVTMRYTFVDPDDGSREVVTMIGEGKDNSDKSASKAASMACKYALFQALMIPFESVDESDQHNDAVAEDIRQRNANAYRHQVREDRIADQREQARPAQGVDMTPAEKASALVRWVQEAQKEPAEKALALVKKARERAQANELGALLVENVPVSAHIQGALQNLVAVIENKAASAGAQGMSRQEQQAGQGARAATPDRLPPVTQDEYDEANRVLADPNADEREMTDALVVTKRFETQITGGE